MKIKIAGKKTYYFSDSIEPEERLVEVNKMLQDTLEFDGESMSIEDYFQHTWSREVNGVNETKNTLDRIATYLSKMPNQDGKQDKEVMSRNDHLEMEKGIRRVHRKGENTYTSGRYIVNSELSPKDKAKMGLVDSEDTEKY